MTTKMKTTTQTPIGLNHPAVMQCRHGNYDPRGLGWCHSGYCPSGEHVRYAQPVTKTPTPGKDFLAGVGIIAVYYVGLFALALIVVFGILMHIGS